MSADILRTFNVTVTGQGEPAIVLAHGFGSDQTAWRHQVEALAPAHRVVRFDHLGCGLSDAEGFDPLVYGDLRRYADDMLRIYDALGLERTIFVGHSAAGMLGALASILRPTAFERLVLIAASPRYLDNGDYRGGFTRDDLNALYTIMADDYLGWANGFGPRVMANADRPELGREFVRTLAALRPDVAQSIARAIFEMDLRAELAHIRHPVLLLHTRDDLFVPMGVAEYMAARIPTSGLTLLDAHGHLPHLSAPAPVTAAIRAFLDMRYPPNAHGEP